MPTGQPEPRRHDLAAPSAAAGPETEDFLDLGLSFGGQPGAAAGPAELLGGADGAPDTGDGDPAWPAAYGHDDPGGDDDEELAPGRAWGGAGGPGPAGGLGLRVGDAGELGADGGDELDALLAGEELDLDDFDLEGEGAEAASWLMELDEGALEGGEDPAVEGFELAMAGPPAPAPVRSALRLAAVVVLSVGSGVALSRFIPRAGVLPVPEPGPAEALALVPRTPAPSPEPPTAPLPPAPAAPEGTPAEPAPAPPGSLAEAEGPLAAVEPPGAAREGRPLRPEPIPPTTGPPPAEPDSPPGREPAPSTPFSAFLSLLGGAQPGSSAGARPTEPEPAPVSEPEPGLGYGFLAEEHEPTGLERSPGPVREATAADLANVWTGSAIPIEALDREEALMTPFVGRVRVVVRQGEIFEGRLHAIGGDKVWLQTGRGKMALMAWQVTSIEHVLGGEGTPAPGEAGSQELAGLPSVRVRTPGGVFYGKLVSRHGDLVTLITADGARISLERGVVEPAGRSTTRFIDESEGPAPARRDG